MINFIKITPKTPVDKSSWCVVEDPPAFPGGTAAWAKYLIDSTNYPKLHSGNNKAVVSIRFIVSKQGFATEVQCLDSIKNNFTAEAIRVIKASPQWIPAKRNGRAISYAMTQGFDFEWEPPTLPAISSSGTIPITNIFYVNTKP